MKQILVSAYKRFFKKTDTIAKNYQQKDYLEAYSEHTDARIKEDPKAAIGGHWEEIGSLQFNFLKQQGLKPSHLFLDIGCGTLRGGRHFIAYLEPRTYTGVDISHKAVEYAEKLVREEGLQKKQPRLQVNETKDLKFTPFAGETFDYILAQSVFTHLMPQHIEECFAHIGKIMHSGSCFYFTYFKSKEYKQINYKDFSYPIEFFQGLSQKYGFELSDYTPLYDHPKQQNMLAIRKKA